MIHRIDQTGVAGRFNGETHEIPLRTEGSHINGRRLNFRQGEQKQQWKNGFGVNQGTEILNSNYLVKILMLGASQVKQGRFQNLVLNEIFEWLILVTDQKLILY